MHTTGWLGNSALKILGGQCTVSLQVITNAIVRDFPLTAMVVQAVSGEEIVKLAEKKVKPLPVENIASSVPSAVLIEALRNFCKSVMGTGVIALSEVKDKLLLRQTTASDNDPLRLAHLHWSHHFMNGSLGAKGSLIASCSPP